MYTLTTERMLVLSTAHITQDIAEDLDNPDADIHSYITTRDHGEYGWLIRTTGSKNSVPDVLRRLLMFARDTDHGWLLLDRDGPKLPYFEKFSW